MYMPEHISGTGDAMNMAGSFDRFSASNNPTSTSDFGTIEAGHNAFFIPEETVGSIFESPDYMNIIDRFVDQFPSDNDAHCEMDPIRQIKTVRGQLKEINRTLDHLLDDNQRRDRREQYIWAGLAGLAVITLLSLFRR